MLENLDAIGTTTATTAALSASNMLAAGDEDGLSVLAATIAHENDAVSMALFCDRNGAVIAHSNPDEEGSYKQECEKTLDSQIIVRSQSTIEIETPVLVSGEPWGTFHIEIPLGPVIAEIKTARNDILRTNGLLLLASILGAAWLARSIARPVEHLSMVANEVALGNLDVQTNMKRAGELGSLPAAIDNMIQDLANSRSRLLKQSDELEIEREKAIQASRAKSEFLANMSHELRTPLTGILGFADVIADDIEDAAALEGLGVIRECGDHLLELINNILDLSKIEADQMAIEEIRFSPAQVIEEVVSLLGPKVDSTKIAFSVSYLGPIPETIHSDPTKLKQIILNILGNSLKFTQAGSIDIEVSHVVDGESSSLRIDIVDTGIGMTSEVAATLFKPFTQAHSSTTREFGGTGLGLSISRRMAQLLTGDIVIAETSPGIGTRFSITIATGSLEGVAIHEREFGTSEPQDSWRDLEGDGKTRRFDGLRVLLADDNGYNRRLIRAMLERAGATVSLAENGKSAIASALHAEDKEEPFDVVLMDMRMPEMDGFCATEILCSRNYERPIIALTANAMSGDKDRCLKSGCVDYQSKPIERSSLFAAIDRATRLAQRS